jgi:hypothetical protein
MSDNAARCPDLPKVLWLVPPLLLGVGFTEIGHQQDGVYNYGKQ